MKDNKGYIHVYTGNGKGKTTSALGLALRAAGHKKKTFFAQFMKNMDYGELFSIARHLSEYIVIRQFGIPGFHHMGDGVSREEIDAATAGVEAVRNAIKSGEYDIIVLDEANILCHFKILGVEDFLQIMDTRPDGVELIFTGRCAPPEFLERADLITEMKEVRHYYQKGVQARDGIER